MNRLKGARAAYNIFNIGKAQRRAIGKGNRTRLGRNWVQINRCIARHRTEVQNVGIPIARVFAAVNRVIASACNRDKDRVIADPARDQVIA